MIAKIISTETFGNRRTAIVRVEYDTYTINIENGYYELWLSQWEEMEGNWSTKELPPKLVKFGKVDEIKKYYDTPKDMILNYHMNANV